MSTPFAARSALRSRGAGSALRIIGLALAGRRQRLHLGELDPHLLDDIGLTEAEAEAEARRPVWDVPAGWRR